MAAGADDAGEAGEVFGEDRVALVGHGAAALLAGVEELLGFAHFAALEVADFGGQALDAAGDDGQGAEEGGVAVAGDDLGGDEFDGWRPSVRRRGPRWPGRDGHRCRRRR